MKCSCSNHNIIMFVFMLIAALDPLNVHAHGTYGSVDMQKGFLVSANYDDGDPMSYTAVTIHNGSETIPYQTGRTDKHGRFMFFPEEKGTYSIVVQDEMGHRVALSIDADGTEASDSLLVNTHPVTSRPMGLFTGLSIVFFISGLGFWLAGKRRTRSAMP